MKLKYDFHIHSCLSPCGDAEMTPNNIANMAKLMGFDVIALTDHNSGENCPALIKVAEEIGLTVIPGMELCTSEEVHAVCLFPDIESSLAFSEYVHSTLPPIKNKPSAFGEQLVMNENDEVVKSEETLLITASTISANKVVSEVEKYGGIAFPAHIDRTSYSIISNLGTINESFGFNIAEIFDIKKEADLKEKYPYLNNMKILSDSDAHYLENMREASLEIDAEANTAKSIIAALSMKVGK